MHKRASSLLCLGQSQCLRCMTHIHTYCPLCLGQNRCFRCMPHTYIHTYIQEVGILDAQEGFEPFVLGSKSVLPLYDERFRGYGWDKTAHAQHLRALGFQYKLLPRHYVIARCVCVFLMCVCVCVCVVVCVCSHIDFSISCCLGIT